MRMLQLLLGICLLRSGPQVLPATNKLVGRLVIAYVVTGMLTLAPSANFGEALQAALFDAGLMLGLLYLATAWQRRTERFRQAAAALAGTGALLGLLLLPVVALSLSGGEAAMLTSLLWLLLFGWSLAIAGHIIRHTFEIPFPFGVLAAVIYFALSMALVQLLFPGLVE